MNTEIYRKYIDIINENSQPDMLTEGMLDSIVQKAKGVMSKLSPNLINDITELVTKALGKSPQELSMADLNMSNIKKVTAAFKDGEVNENWEYEPLPGTLAKDKAKFAGLGAGIGAVGGTLATILMINPFTLAGAATIAGCAIAVAYLTSHLGTGTQVRTGVFKDMSGKPKSYDPSKRDPRLPPKA
jgi:hypothetical protein